MRPQLPFGENDAHPVSGWRWGTCVKPSVVTLSPHRPPTARWWPLERGRWGSKGWNPKHVGVKPMGAPGCGPCMLPEGHMTVNMEAGDGAAVPSGHPGATRLSPAPTGGRRPPWLATVSGLCTVTRGCCSSGWLCAHSAARGPWCWRRGRRVLPQCCAGQQKRPGNPELGPRWEDSGRGWGLRGGSRGRGSGAP